MKFLLIFLFFFSFSAFSAKKKTVKNITKNAGKKPIKNTKIIKKQQEEVIENPEDFVPSLSQTLSDTNRLKKQIKKQVADNMTKKPEEEVSEEDKTKPNLSRETAHFGDLEVSISERTEEDVKPILKKKPKLKRKIKRK